VSIFSVAQLQNKLPSIQTKQRDSLMNFNSQRRNNNLAYMYSNKSIPGTPH
jgi:hypothetical protein